MINLDKILGLEEAQKPEMSDLEQIREIMKSDLDEAREEYDHAQQMFDYADEEFIEVAIDLLTAAKMKLDATIKKIKIIDDMLETWRIAHEVKQEVEEIFTEDKDE